MLQLCITGLKLRTYLDSEGDIEARERVIAYVVNSRQGNISRQTRPPTTDRSHTELAPPYLIAPSLNREDIYPESNNIRTYQACSKITTAPMASVDDIFKVRLAPSV
jgi:hypothetical protein